MAKQHVHLIGIGGTGMTALAGLLLETGCRVTGSDRKLYPPTSEILARLDAVVEEGFDFRHLDPAPALVVVGNAISRGNPELEEVLDRRLPMASMPELIADRFLADRHSIVVAGTHGKTTTASMLAWILTHAGRDPSFLIGGAPFNFDFPFRLGRGPAFVIEGDEYDSAFFDKGPKFMHYRPQTALVGTVEFDHADIYRDLDQVKTVFRRLVNLVPRRGLVVQDGESEITREVTSGAFSRVEDYGLGHGFWNAEEFDEIADGCRFRLSRAGKFVREITVPMPGRHNAKNALAAIAAASEQGLEIDEIASGLESFKGVRRRLEVRGVIDGITVLDDFAHHPTAIAKTLETIRHRFADRRVWAVFEPRSWSMRRNIFQDRLPEAFESADRILVAAVYAPDAVPEHQRLDVEKLIEAIRARGCGAEHLPGVSSIVSRLVDGTRAGDVVVILSNGAFGGLHEALLDALRASREVQPG